MLHDNKMLAESSLRSLVFFFLQVPEEHSHFRRFHGPKTKRFIFLSFFENSLNFGQYFLSFGIQLIGSNCARLRLRRRAQRQASDGLGFPLP